MGIEDDIKAEKEAEQRASRVSENIVIKRSPRDELGKITIWIVLLWYAIYGTLNLPWSIQKVFLGTIAGYQVAFYLPFFLLFPLVFGIYILHRLYNYLYVLTPDYVLEVSGRISFNLKSQRIRYAHIRGVNVEQNIFQRIFNVGDIRLASAMQQRDSDVLMEGVANPNLYKDIINQRIHEAINNGGASSSNDE